MSQALSSSPEFDKEAVLGLVLAGGTSRRMGCADKFLLKLGEKRLIDHVVDRLLPQVGQLAISANGDPSRLKYPLFPIIPDKFDLSGPLAGVLSAMGWMQQNTACRWLVTAAADSPFIPKDYVQCLMADRPIDQARFAQYKESSHYTFCLWPLEFMPAIQSLFDQGERALKNALATLPSQPVNFSDSLDSFFNINTPTDLSLAHQRLARS